ncbi:MAG: hypothetical protein NXI24_11320 [bacterium]|nr:hypothetical protein [bacterium]
MQRVLKFLFQTATALLLSLTALQLTACIAGYQRGASAGAAHSAQLDGTTQDSVRRKIPGRDDAGKGVGDRVLNFAHRGASAYVAEHTLEAYRTALAQGADYLEVDVHGTGDGELVLIHDASLERTAGEDQLVRDLSLTEIRAIDPEILTVQQLFAAFPDTPINIEIKQREPSIAAQLAAALRAAEREELVIVSSGSGDAIEEFRAASAGRVATGAALSEVLGVYGNYLFDLDLDTPIPFDALQVPYRSILGIDLSTPEFIAYAHAHDLEIHYWTVDEAPEMERLIQAGANGIMTNRPDILSNVLAASVPDSPDAATNTN